MVRRPTRKRFVFVEGGGDNNDALRSECRRAFKKFLERAGLEGRLPRVIPCGGRRSAFDQFCTAVSSASDDDVIVLLVDSDASISAASPWEHVKQRQGDGWDKPDDATDDDLHLMVECMESWFLADKDVLAGFYGQGFAPNSLPANPEVENVSKPDVYSGLINATRQTMKGAYGKGTHSFKILALVDPAKVRGAAPFADRLLNHLHAVL